VFLQLVVAEQQCSYKLKDTSQRSPSVHQTVPKGLDLCSVCMHACSKRLVHSEHSHISALLVQANNRQHRKATNLLLEKPSTMACNYARSYSYSWACHAVCTEARCRLTEVHCKQSIAVTCCCCSCCCCSHSLSAQTAPVIMCES
jgi:hypothetical protein